MLPCNTFMLCSRPTSHIPTTAAPAPRRVHSVKHAPGLNHPAITVFSAHLQEIKSNFSHQFSFFSVVPWAYTGGGGIYFQMFPYFSIQYFFITWEQKKRTPPLPPTISRIRPGMVLTFWTTYTLYIY